MAHARKALCPQCSKFHMIDPDTFAMFGYDCHCMKCVRLDHLDYMAKHPDAKCVDGCECQTRKQSHQEGKRA